LAKITLLFVLSLTYLWLYLRTVLLCAFNILFSAFTLSSWVHTGTNASPGTRVRVIIESQEFACILIAAVHNNNTGSLRVRVTLNTSSFCVQFLFSNLRRAKWTPDSFDVNNYS